MNKKSIITVLLTLVIVTGAEVPGTFCAPFNAENAGLF